MSRGREGHSVIESQGCLASPNAQGEYKRFIDVGEGSQNEKCPFLSKIEMQFGKTITCLGSWESKTSWFLCQEERL